MRSTAGPGIYRTGLDEWPIASRVATAYLKYHRLTAKPPLERRVIAGNREFGIGFVRLTDLPNDRLGG